MSLLYYALVSTGAGVFWWRHLRPRASRPAPTPLDDDAQVAMHLARREALLRDQPLGSLHVLYGLLQVEAITAAIGAAGGDPDALETRVLDALGGDATDDPPEVVHGLVRAALAAAAERAVSCVDLWAALRGARADQVLDAAGVDRRAVLYLLVHGEREAAPAVATGPARVVLHDDPYTTQAFVVEALVAAGLDEPTATEVMNAAHTGGRASLAACPAALARARVLAIRTHARAHGFPLRVEVEAA